MEMVFTEKSWGCYVDNPELAGIAAEVQAKLRAVIETL